MSHIRFIYLRTRSPNLKQRGEPKACIAMRYDSINGNVYYQFSACHPKDKFSKELAREIAEGRLYSDLARVVKVPKAVMASFELTKLVLEDLVNNESPNFMVAAAVASKEIVRRRMIRPDVVRHAAKRWLKENQEDKRTSRKQETAA